MKIIRAARSSILLPACLLSVFYLNIAIAKDDVERTGDILAVLIPASGLGATVIYEDGNEGMVQFFKSFATTGITTEVLKIATHKERPNGSCCRSFPSGHTSTAFMGASFIHKRYGWQYSVAAYLGASYVGFSRIHAHKHYGVDVLAGAAVGTLSSFYFTEPYKGFVITPVVGNGIYSLGISSTW
jgi:membrane-associated phospholipid phosphatase